MEAVEEGFWEPYQVNVVLADEFLKRSAVVGLEFAQAPHDRFSSDGAQGDLEVPGQCVVGGFVEDDFQASSRLVPTGVIIVLGGLVKARPQVVHGHDPLVSSVDPLAKLAQNTGHFTPR